MGMQGLQAAGVREELHGDADHGRPNHSDIRDATSIPDAFINSRTAVRVYCTLGHRVQEITLF